MGFLCGERLWVLNGKIGIEATSSNGIIVPFVVVLVIVALSSVTWFFNYRSNGFVIGIVSTIEEMLVLVAIPLLLGLVWNRWAGGASGFLIGSIYSTW